MCMRIAFKGKSLRCTDGVGESRDEDYKTVHQPVFNLTVTVIRCIVGPCGSLLILPVLEDQKGGLVGRWGQWDSHQSHR